MMLLGSGFISGSNTLFLILTYINFFISIILYAVYVLNTVDLRITFLITLV